MCIRDSIKDNRQKENFSSLATTLGYNENDKLLIIHADDVGLSESVNESTFESFKNNSITSASIIMNTYEMEEGLKFAVENPNFDFGVHLTVTSEWKYHKWGGILDKAKTPSLHNSVNNFYWNKRKFVKNANLNEIKMELQAQIDLAKSMGLKPSHIDSHEGALFFDPNIFKLYIDLALENDLLAFVPIEASMHFNGELEKPSNAVIIDQFHMLHGGTKVEDIKNFYFNVIRSLKPGLSQIIIHLGKDEPELKKITVDHPNFDYRWRQKDHDIMNSKEFKNLLQPGDVIYVKKIDNNYFSLKQLPRINGAIVVMDPYTGRVLAMSGGFSFKRSEFNRATQALRQPGSAFKPFVYALALENNYTPSTLILDAPLVLDQGEDLKQWKPENYGKKFYGCLLYTSPSPRDATLSRMPSSA